VVSLHHAKVKTSTLREKVHTDAVYKKVSWREAEGNHVHITGSIVAFSVV
jgi:hypothetical protein